VLVPGGAGDEPLQVSPAGRGPAGGAPDGPGG